MPDKDRAPEVVRLGIIGAGLATKQLHWPPLRRLDDRFKVVVVADVVPEAAQGVAALAGNCRWVLDYRELLAADDVDAVLVSLPIHLNAQVLVESVRAGKHVLCEKPIGSNLAQAREAVAAVRGAPVVVLIAEQFHYRRDIALAREHIEQGHIGKVFMIDAVYYYWTDTSVGFGSTPWRHDSQYRGGAVTDAGVHLTAMLRELGGEVEQLQAFTKLVHPELSGVDTLALNLRFRSGALGNLTFSGGAVEADTPFVNATVLGTEGAIWLREGTLRVRRRGGADELMDDYDSDDAFFDQWVNFHEAITEGAPVVATPEEALRDLEILMRAYDSAESRSVVLLS